MSDASTSGTEQFEFRGKAGEWFGIWIVNLLLSIITIGIYSAWAKVRRKKYFYNHTYVADRNFDYHATGKQILIGRIIVVAGFIIFQLAVTLVPILGIILLLALLVVIPWLIVKSIMFNARVSSFSNVRFNFEGKVSRAFVILVLYPILAYILIGALGAGAGYMSYSGSIAGGAVLGVLAFVATLVAFPIIDRLVKMFSINGHSLGTAAFNLDITTAPFIKAMAAALAWIIFVCVVGAVLMGGSIAGMMMALEPGGEPTPEFIAAIGTLYVLIFVALLPAGIIYQAIIRNAVYGATTLEGGHQFRSTVGAGRMFWIALSNAVVVVLSLGLMLPWAQVRMAKYLAANTFLMPGESLDSFVGRQEAEGMSVADAYTDLEGIDFGVPL